MKRILGLFLALSLVLSCLNVCAAGSNSDKDDYTYNIRVMKELGLVSASLDGSEEKTATRGDAAKIFAALFPSYEKAVKVFADVEPEGELGNAVYSLWNLGIVTGSGDSLFLPDDNVTGDELACMAVRALGAGRYAEKTGGYPVGCYSVLTSVFGIKLTGGEPFTVGRVISFARKVADSEIVNMTDANGIERYNVANGKTLLSSSFGIYKYKGRVTANRITGLYSENAKVRDGIRIDDEEYFADAKYDSLLGYNTEAYYKTEKEQKTLVCAFSLPKENDVMVFENDNLPEFEDNKYVLAEGRREFSYDIGGDSFAFIYNDVACGSMQKAMFEPEKGRITLIDTDRDGIYDVVKVESGESYYTEDVTKEHISVRNGEGIDFESGTAYRLENSGGTPIEISDIQKHTIITVFRAHESKYFRIAASNNEITGILREMYTDSDGKNMWNIDGNEYAADESTASFDSIRAGMRVTVLTDVFNEIVYCKSWDGEYYFYAVLGDVGKGGALGDTVMFKMYDSDGVIRITDGGDKIDIDGKACRGYDEVRARLNKALCNINYCKENKKLDDYVSVPVTEHESLRQFIRYRLGNGGKISEIDTAAPWMDDDYENTLHLDSFSLGNTSVKSKPEIGMLGATMPYDSETVFFWVNTDSSEDHTFYVENGGKSLLDDVLYNADGYYTGDSVVADYVVITTENSESVPIGDWNRLIVVDQKMSVMKNDEIYSKISYYEGYNYVGKFEAVEKTHGLLDGVDKGDILRISTLGGDISKVEMIYDYSADKITGTKGDYFDYPHIMAGDVYKKTDGKIVVTTADASAGVPASSTCCIYDAEKFPIISISEGKDVTIGQGSSGDIKSYENFSGDCSKVFVHMVGGKPITLIVLNRK